MEDSRRLVEEIGASIRCTIDELRPRVLDDFGLFAALRWQADRFTSSTGLSVRVRGGDPSPPLPANIAIQLLRVVQEALTNVTRHARASRVLIALRAADGLLRLTVADNGAGFRARAADAPQPRGGLGLLTMRERAESVGGELTIRSHPGRGTRIHVRVPIAGAHRPA